MSQPTHLTVVSTQQPQTTRKPNAPKTVFWDRRELDAILNIYGRRVAAGDWRDYAMSGLKDVAVFSVYRRTSEIPLYRIEKRPKLRNRQGAYAVIAASGLILKRGHELKQVLKVLEPKQLSLVTDV
ncbi:DUF2794 domain-containing protein [Pyruvatibacter sp.]|uniref:DUF2794 domain-containing protein n=1 Tax=Pyruvatibacter sp. TaxID=1981328 RepID=UPI0032EA99EC